MKRLQQPVNLLKSCIVFILRIFILFQCEILELMMMYYKDFTTDVQGFIQMMEKFTVCCISLLNLVYANQEGKLRL